MPGRVGVANAHRGLLYTEMLKYLEEHGPTTREELYRVLEPHVPFEKALRMQENNRLRKTRNPKAARRFTSEEERIRHGRRQIIARAMRSSLMHGRVVLDHVDPPGQYRRPNDVFRLRNENEEHALDALMKRRALKARLSREKKKIEKREAELRELDKEIEKSKVSPRVEYHRSFINENGDGPS